MRGIRTSLPIVAAAAVLAAVGMTPATAAAAPPAARVTAQAEETTVYEEGQPGGLLFYSGNLGSNSPWQPSPQSKTVRYPAIGEYLTPIGYLKIIDNLDSGYSTATIKAGGVGSNYVEIEYDAPAFRGYDYNVEIRGVKLL
ncbi:MBF2 family protein [Streptomyces sp. MUM 16J]|uniref:MBF2 family protein n=1 Tax=Streptomyces sp. MUM 16J TaxID=2791988 RepID=UPI001F037657|nr:MBF2 family protein [Streptomyces sp. MUM 16J]MCH0557959.1 hypothetical protein [Streptomyces sp. MUM 16J]